MSRGLEVDTGETDFKLSVVCTADLSEKLLSVEINSVIVTLLPICVDSEVL